MYARVKIFIAVGWLAWMSPIDGAWSPIGKPFEVKEDCVDMLFAMARGRPDLLEGHIITCRPEGEDPNATPGEGQTPQRSEIMETTAL